MRLFCPTTAFIMNISLYFACHKRQWNDLWINEYGKKYYVGQIWSYSNIIELLQILLCQYHSDKYQSGMKISWLVRPQLSSWQTCIPTFSDHSDAIRYAVTMHRWFIDRPSSARCSWGSVIHAMRARYSRKRSVLGGNKLKHNRNHESADLRLGVQSAMLRHSRSFVEPAFR